MRVAQNQAFYGQVVGFLDIMKVSVFIVLEWKTFENADWSKLETQGKYLHILSISVHTEGYCMTPPTQALDNLGFKE